MSIVDLILSVKRREIWDRFRGLRLRDAPRTRSIQEAYKQGLQTGYGEGLIDGVDLGLDVGCITPGGATTFDSPENFMVEN